MNWELKNIIYKFGYYFVKTITGTALCVSPQKEVQFNCHTDKGFIIHENCSCLDVYQTGWPSIICVSSLAIQ